MECVFFCGYLEFFVFWKKDSVRIKEEEGRIMVRNGVMVGDVIGG